MLRHAKGACSLTSQLQVGGFPANLMVSGPALHGYLELSFCAVTTGIPEHARLSG